MVDNDGRRPSIDGDGSTGAMAFRRNTSSIPRIPWYLRCFFRDKLQFFSEQVITKEAADVYRN